MKLSRTRWFRVLQAYTKALAAVRGVDYPNGDPLVNATLHAEAERQMGSQLEKLVRTERR